MALAIGSDKTISNTHYANGKLFAGSPCIISMNITWIKYYWSLNAFINIFKQSGTWFEPNSGTETVVYDANNEIASSSLNANVRALTIENSQDDYIAGAYKATWVGTGSLTVNGSGVSNIVTGANWITFDLAQGTDVLNVVVTNGSATSIAVFLQSDEAKHLAGQLWSDSFIAFHSKYKTLRFMNPMETNGSWYKDVGEMPTLGGHNWGESTPPEAIAELANATNTIPWVCVPHLASDALVTDFFTRLNSVLDPGRKVRVELSNEVWNSGGVFKDQTAYFCYPGNPVQYSTAINGNVFTKVAHGMTTGQAVRCYRRSKDSTYDNRYARSQPQWVIAISADTFSLAISEANALSGIANSPPADLTELAYRPVTAAEATPAGENWDWSGSYKTRSEQVWALADAVLTRARCEHICAIHTAGGNFTPRLGVDADYIAIAPYMIYTDIPTILTATDDEILDHLVNTHIPILESRIVSLRQYSNLPIICYEAGDESYTTDSALQAVITRFYNSPQMRLAQEAYGQLLAKTWVEEVCLFENIGYPFGYTEFLHKTATNQKQSAVDAALPLGFTRS